MAYCTTGDFYIYTGLTSSIVGTSVVQTFIDRAYASIKQRTNTVYASTTTDLSTVTEILDGAPNYSSEGVDYLVLDKYPVNSISSLSIDGNNVTTADYVVKYDRIMIGTDSPTSTFGTRLNGVQITYTYGVYDAHKKDLATELNVLLTMYNYMITPAGKDVFLDNSRYSEINQNNVRPIDATDAYLTQIKSRIDEIFGELGTAHVYY